MFKCLSYFACLAFLTSCASKHTLMRGSVAFKISNTTGIACLESNQVKLGDTLALLNNDCTQNKGREGAASCRLVPVGKVEVTRIVNDHYSEFKTLEATEFAEGSLLEPAK